MAVRSKEVPAPQPPSPEQAGFDPSTFGSYMKPPSWKYVVGTESSSPKKLVPVQLFPKAEERYVVWKTEVPEDITNVSGLRLLWRSPDDTGDVVWRAQVSATTPNVGEDPLPHGFDDVVENIETVDTLGELYTTTLDFTVGFEDDAEIGDLLVYCFFRAPGATEDTCDGDIELWNASYKYVGV